MVSVVGQNTPYFVRQAHFADDRMAGSVPAWKNNGADNIAQSGSASSLSLAGTNAAPDITPPSLSFSEVLDVMNPLHHIPIVGSVYRGLTGDNISPVARIAGGTLYGGPIGGMSSLAHAAIEEHSGQNTGDAIRSAMNNDRPVYTIDDDPRTAGLSQKNTEDNITAAKTDDLIEVAAIVPQSKPNLVKPSESNLFETMETEQRKPVTRLFIDMAEAPLPEPKQQWNFNA